MPKGHTAYRQPRLQCISLEKQKNSRPLVSHDFNRLKAGTLSRKDVTYQKAVSDYNNVELVPE